MIRGEIRPFFSTFDELLRNYVEALDWLKSIGPVDGGSRLSTYLKLLSELASVETVISYNVLLGRDEIRAAFFEAAEIIDVYSTFRALSSKLEIHPDIVGKLHKGAVSYVGKNVEDRSRNTFTQLFVASRLIQNGLPAEISPSGADVVTELSGYKVFVECKRVESSTQYLRRLKEGLAQLENRYSKGKSKEAGVVFMSVDKVVNPDLLIQTVDTLEDAQLDSNNLLAPFADYVEKVDRHRLSSKTLAFFTEASLLYSVGPANTLVYRSYYYSRHFFTKKTTPYFILFQDIEGKFLAKPPDSSSVTSYTYIVLIVVAVALLLLGVIGFINKD